MYILVAERLHRVGEVQRPIPDRVLLNTWMVTTWSPVCLHEKSKIATSCLMVLWSRPFPFSPSSVLSPLSGYGLICNLLGDNLHLTQRIQTFFFK